MKTLAIVHLFYGEMWPELNACLKNIGEHDLVITYVDDAAIARVKEDVPSAKFIKTENRGYDVWPLVCALKAVDLNAYDLVVKLHSKRDIAKPHPFVMGGVKLNGSAWRDYLLNFVRTPEAWAKTRARFCDPAVGMVADRRLIYSRTEGGKSAFDDAARELKEKFALDVPRSAYFVGGTMFAVRASLLKVFRDYPFTPEMFTVSGPHEPTTYAHLMERMLGLAVCAQGYRLAGFNGSLFAWRFSYRLKRFFFDSRWSERRRSIRICGITVYRRKLAV